MISANMLPRFLSRRDIVRHWYVSKLGLNNTEALSPCDAGVVIPSTAMWALAAETIPKQSVVTSSKGEGQSLRINALGLGSGIFVASTATRGLTGEEIFPVAKVDLSALGFR